MKVILLQDINKLGKKYEIKNVSDGHARNLLIPKGLVKPATKEALEWLEIQKEMIKKNEEDDLKQAETQASSIDGMELMIPVKVGNEGEMFESINSQKISERFKELGLDIKKSQIALELPIKETGEFPVKIHFPHNLEVEIKVIIVEEK